MVTIDEVRAFWQDHPCGADVAEATDRREYFEEQARARYGPEAHIHEVARFGTFAGRDVLEIGCGIGADGAEFAQAGARYTGIDLTEAAVELSRERFSRLGLPGEFVVADARELPFEDRRFDHVYSFGVIHCSPDTPAIVREIRRVLRPGGTTTVMVYNRASINYHVEIMGLRKLARVALAPRPGPAILSRLTGLDRAKLERHRERMLGGELDRDDTWLSANTDGPDCPLATVYGEVEAAELFRDFADVRQEVHFFDTRHWPVVGSRLPPSLVRLLGRRWGWHRVIYASV